MNTNSHRKANWSRLGAWVLVSLVLAVGIMYARQNNEANAKSLYQQGLHEKDARGNLKAAIALYERVLAAKPDRALAAKALLQMADCYERLGMAESRKTYERVVREFSDQSEQAAVAKARIAALPAVAMKADSGVISRKLFDSATLSFPYEAVSPDGRYIAYPSIQPGPRGLMVRDLASGKDRQLTDYGMNQLATTSIFSPDSRMIAFRVFTKEPNGQDLRIIRADGSGERVIFENENVTASHPQDWSRDGKSILAAFNTKDRTWQIAIISVADGSVRRIKTSNWQLGPPSALFSPDGSQIVYHQLQQVGTTSSDIFLLAADGSREQRLVQHPADDKVVGWAPDGRLLFTSDRSGTWDLYALRVSAGIAVGNPEIIQRQIPGSGHGLTRDGTLHYINLHKVNGAYIAGLDIKSGKLTTPPVPVTETTRDYNWTPAFSPDGGQVAVISFRGVGRIYVIIKSLTTATQEREINVEGLRVAYDLLWHPDGKSLLIRGNDKEFQWGIHQLDLATGRLGKPILRVPLENNLGQFELSRDGEVLFYDFRDPSSRKSTLRSRNLRTGAERDLYQAAPSDDFSFALAPGGKRIAVIDDLDWTKDFATWKVLDIESGNTWTIPKIKRATWAPLWTPDEKHLVFTSNNSWWRVAVEDGTMTELGPTNAVGIQGTKRMHPDGTLLAFFTVKEISEFWMMENLLSRQVSR